MINNTTKQASQDAIEWAITHGMVIKATAYSASHTAFSFTPTPISRERFHNLVASVNLLGKLVHYASEDHQFLSQAIAPVTSGEPFFKALLEMHNAIYDPSNADNCCNRGISHRGDSYLDVKNIDTKMNDSNQSDAKRLPLLIMRSDFMDDTALGPKLIEFNGIAAGMGPFGQRVHELHQYLQQQWPEEFKQWSSQQETELVANQAIERLSQGIANATFKIKNEFADSFSSKAINNSATTYSENNPPVFLMVVQADEDNVFDQHLLEGALQAKGIRTVRRTFRELHNKLSTGANHRLLLEGVGPIDTVYLRAGYQYSDYHANDIISRVCCEALMQTRIFIERHRVAVNATVSQQLATSKRVQMLLSSMEPDALTRFGLTLDEAKTVKGLLGEMRAVTKGSAASITQTGSEQWVLKNQGEGGGHCIFGDDILSKLAELKPCEYQAWSLMRRLHPTPRPIPALTVRKGELLQVDDLISEIGMFTVHIDGEAAIDVKKIGVKQLDVQGLLKQNIDNKEIDIKDINVQATDKKAYAGYLIRSKSARTTEGGVHSGMGVLDSLIFGD
ncbi:Glutathione synthase [Shewanella halifaxensis HAW-EB4]|uniref:Glutathione synthase n=1 Tax=Shewanella halifaxensis (strain HAW-EB4) TaxID=458817 RepID=B0TSZ4_SHEHH|nr:glutathione synthase [Shewanella halifaxensis]ABZ76555.1 Glutathione synthase [Shewanella halifaxensis HAW-EB4]